MAHLPWTGFYKDYAGLLTGFALWQWQQWYMDRVLECLGVWNCRSFGPCVLTCTQRKLI